MHQTSIVIAGFLAAGALIQTANAQQLPTEPLVCQYARLPERAPFGSLDPTRLTTSNEIEPNDSVATAQAIPLGLEDGFDPDVDIDGRIDSFNKDFYKFEAKRGQILGVAVLAIDANELDSHVCVLDSTGTELVLNFDHQIGSSRIGDLYPPDSPLPTGGLRRDSILSFAFPADGTYFVRVEGRGANQGGYRTQFRLREGGLVNESAGTQQILFLDFDGAVVNAQRLFGSGGQPTASLSPFADFMANWGIPANREDALIDAITSNVREHFDELLVSAGSGVSIDIRNSKDDSDPFSPGNPFVSRVVVGGTIAELGISTIGIAECIDPGNFSTDDTAVVLLDLLSAPASNPNSVLSIPRGPGVTIEDAVAKVVAAVVSHEACHFLGCWHTENSNTVASLIDQGGSIRNTAATGQDGVLDTTDPANAFVRDHYANERIGRTIDKENVGARVLVALATGRAQSPDSSEELTNLLITGLQRYEDIGAERIRAINDIRTSIGIMQALDAAEAPHSLRIEAALDSATSKIETLRAK